MSLYKFYTATVGDAAASLDIVSSGKITGIKWAVQGDLDADAEALAAEISFSSTSGFTSNDTKSSVSSVRALAVDTGAAASNKLVAINQFDGPLNVAVQEGERMYLHTSGAAIVATVYMYVDDGITGGRRSGRRVRI